VILVDSALRQRADEGRPVRVGMVGAGAMGQAIALQIRQHTPGMELVAICNRTPETAERALVQAGADEVRRVATASALESAYARGVPAVTDDPALVCGSDVVDVVLEVTGAVEAGARVVLDALASGKHVVTMNAELQGTVGPVLKGYADRAGVVLTDSDGDQPGVMMNLHRFVQQTGARPVLVGNMKGLQDFYRTPTTQAEFARRGGLSPQMATSFADGTKMTFENALVANATGMRVRPGGMLGPDCEGEDVADVKRHWPLEELLDGPGLVDYVVGARPAPGVFVLATHDHPLQRHWMRMYKQGDGPVYTYFVPYHLCHMEVPITLARAALFQDAAVAPHAGHVMDVVTTAKRDLVAGEVLDGIGFHMSYGTGVNVADAQAGGLLPMGVSEGCTLVRDVGKDCVLTYADVEVPAGRLVDRLRAEQAGIVPS
jgi:predicted homoserine dehydrogenase-like protein